MQAKVKIELRARLSATKVRFTPQPHTHSVLTQRRRASTRYDLNWTELMATNRDKKSDEMSSPDRPRSLGVKARDRRVQVVRVLLEGSFDRKLGLRDMGAEVNLSSWRLAHLFKSETGMSPQRYLTLVRLQRAKDLLETTFLSVQEIGAAVGIRNPSQFTKTFKAAYGMTPVEYRRTQFETLALGQRPSPTGESSDD
jgi:transcriptional regulator GlxA family with amidase domain